MFKFSIAAALDQLSEVDSTFLKLFEHGSLVLEMYKPEERDLQEPHSRDEVYVIASGSGIFQHNGKQAEVAKGDFLFVPAGDEHKFIEFTEDFSTWVLFYGPEGGD